MNDDRVVRMRQRRAEGVTLDAIGVEFNLSRQRVCQLIGPTGFVSARYRPEVRATRKPAAGPRKRAAADSANEAQARRAKRRETVLGILEDKNQLCLSIPEIALKRGVSQMTVYRVLEGKVWSRVTGLTRATNDNA